MDSFEWNKIAGAVLFALLVTFGISIVSETIFETEAPEVPGYVIAVPDATEGGEEAPAEQSIATLLATADPAAGETASRQCAACHTFGEGEPNRVGPNLYGVVNRPIASHEGFEYSQPMQDFAEANQTWTFEHLNTFLEHPQQTVPDTLMVFPGIGNDQQRANVIAYLNTLSASPAPYPEPEAAPAEGAASTEGEAPAEGEATAEAAAPAEGQATAEAGAPAEAEAPAEAAPAEGTEQAAEAPAAEQPAAEAPAPAAEAPTATEEPAAAEASAAEGTATAEAPAEAPAAEVPATETAEAPATEAPSAEAPATETAEAPAAAEPAASAEAPAEATPAAPAETGTAQAEPAPATEAPAEAAPTAGAESAFGALVAAADAANGEAIARRCAACHTFEKDAPSTVGPNLFGVVGRPVASVEGYAYSPAMVEFSEGGAKAWTHDDLNGYLTDPRKVVPGTKMIFPGLRNETERADLIAYLGTLAD